MDKRARRYLKELGLHVPGWEASTAQRDGRDVAVVVTKGPEIHFVSLGGPAMTRKNILEFLAPLIEKHGYATTRVPIDVTDHKLREHLGFTETWRDANYSYWAMTELPLQRRHTWTRTPAISPASS